MNTAQSLSPSPLLQKYISISDYSMIPVPGYSLKLTSTMLDSFLKDLRDKQRAEIAVKGLLLLKAACVMGDVFCTRELQAISPLRHESMKGIQTVLRLLEGQDYVEILDETDSKNWICRFRKSFMRESIYQVMLYRAQKKGLHQLMVQQIQENGQAQSSVDPEIEADKLLNHILMAEDLASEDQVPSKSKQCLIIKKIANKLLKNPLGVMKEGYLTKQGDKPSKKVEKRLMLVTAKELTWYHNEAEYRKNKPLGVIYLTAIYHCVPANTQKSTDDVNIGTCAWRKKDVEKEGKREFIFGAQDEGERDEWITCIEYLRTKATYDCFVQKYCNVAFPIKQGADDIVSD